MALRVTAILLYLAGLSVADGNLRAPEKVYFSSVNTENVLHWSPASGSPANTLFDVKYTRYGTKGDWMEVPNCTNTSNWSCDLTEETWESNDSFIAQVRSIVKNVTSEWKWSERFRPIDVTFLGTPTFDVRVDLNQLVVRIDPLVLRRGSRAKSMREVFGFRLVNVIRLRENVSHQPFQEFNDSGALDLWRSAEKTPGKVYCVSVRASISSRGNEGNISSEKCLLIPLQPQGSDVGSVVVGVASAVIFTIVLLCVFFGIFYHHLSKKPEIPSVLKSFVKSNSKCRSLLDYPMLVDEVVLQVLFDSKLLCSAPEPGDSWREVNIAQASSVDSGIDLSGHSGSQSSGQSTAPRRSGPLGAQTSAQSVSGGSGQCGAWSGERFSVVCDEEPNQYMQQRPEPVALQSSGAPEGGGFQEHGPAPDSGLSPAAACGYQKQSSNAASATRQDTRLESPPPQDNVMSFSSSPGHLSSADCFSKGILTLDDLVMTEATL